jgi:hypothetical protein
VERSDTGLGRDAYGPPRRDRSHDGYGYDAPLAPEDGYSSSFSPDEEDEGAGLGERGQTEADGSGPAMRHAGDVPARPQSPGEPVNQPIRPPGRFTPNLSPSLSPGFTPTLSPAFGVPNGGLPNGGVPNGGVPGAGAANGGMADGGLSSEIPNGDRIPGRQ